jgi:hypothetical protein
MANLKLDEVLLNIGSEFNFDKDLLLRPLSSDADIGLFIQTGAVTGVANDVMFIVAELLIKMILKRSRNTLLIALAGEKRRITDQTLKDA